jgi:prevent-host-death family protein
MQVNVNEGKTQLSRLLELVQEGETVIIARRGEPVAELVPARRK